MAPGLPPFLYRVLIVTQVKITVFAGNSRPEVKRQRLFADDVDIEPDSIKRPSAGMDGMDLCVCVCVCVCVIFELVALGADVKRSQKESTNTMLGFPYLVPAIEERGLFGWSLWLDGFGVGV